MVEFMECKWEEKSNLLRESEGDRGLRAMLSFGEKLSDGQP